VDGGLKGYRRAIGEFWGVEGEGDAPALWSSEIGGTGKRVPDKRWVGLQYRTLKGAASSEFKCRTL
jgi:hypothetical protein